jgi:hypothetical protein
MPEPRLELLPDVSRASETEHCRETDALARYEVASELDENGLAEPGLLEAPGEAGGADVARVPERRLQLDDAGGDGGISRQRGPREVVGQVSGEEILEPAKSDEDEAAAPEQVAGGHRLGQQSRRLRDADGGRNEDVLVEGAAVAVVDQAGLEPVEAGTDELDGNARVGMLRVGGGEFRQHPSRAVDRPVGVAEHVDRRRREVGRADALREDNHPLSFLGQTQRRGQAGEARADDDGVVAARPDPNKPRASGRHWGRCWTERRPWKIQSSRRAWRSWSPWRIGWTPFHRSSRKSTSAEFAARWSRRSKE